MAGRIVSAETAESNSRVAYCLFGDGFSACEGVPPEVFSFEKEARFQAVGSLGIATKEGQMSHMKGGLVDALVKEIERNR